MAMGFSLLVGKELLYGEGGSDMLLGDANCSNGNLQLDGDNFCRLQTDRKDSLHPTN